MRAALPQTPSHNAAQNKLATLSTNSSHRTIEGAKHVSLIVDEKYAHTTTQAVAAVAVLIAAGVPFLSVNFGQGDPRILPASYDSRAVADTLSARFPGEQAEPIKIVAQRPATDPAVIAYARRSRPCPGSTR